MVKQMQPDTAMDYREIDALIRLLDDTDEEVYGQIRLQLLKCGKPAIPFLESAWGGSLDALLQARIEEVIHDIQFDDLKQEIRVWVETGGMDILRGAVLVARYQYPDLQEDEVRKQLEAIRRDAWLEMNDGLTALEQVHVLNRILFDIHGFSGNTQNYHAPQNSFINVALESKKGNPLMLSIIYMEVANAAGVPVYGVNLPEHFVLCYRENTDLSAGVRGNVLFYINPFSKGDIFNHKEIDQFLQQLKLKPEPSYYAPCSNIAMIQRLIRNLMNSYHKLGFMEKVKELEEMMRATV
jgi:regulator of sirC expression with transglutaminase-like and TPR domain